MRTCEQQYEFGHTAPFPHTPHAPPGTAKVGRGEADAGAGVDDAENASHLPNPGAQLPTAQYSAPVPQKPCTLQHCRSAQEAPPAAGPHSADSAVGDGVGDRGFTTLVHLP